MFKKFFGITRKRSCVKRCVPKRTAKGRSKTTTTSTKLKKTYKNGYLVKVTNPKGKKQRVAITDSMWYEKGKRKTGLLASYDKKPYRRIAGLKGTMEGNAVKYAKKGHREVIIRD